MITKLAACEGVLTEAVVATGDHTWDACTPARDDHANSDLTIDCPTDFSAVQRAHKVAVRWLLEQSAYDCNSGNLRSLTKLRAKARVPRGGAARRRTMGAAALPSLREPTCRGAQTKRN